MLNIKYIIFFGLIFNLILSSCSDDNSVNNQNDLEWNKKIARNVVHSHAKSLQAILSKIQSTEEKIMMIRTSIDSVRFYDDKSGYFYVYDYDCINIAHATQKDLQGQNLYNYQDTKGKYVIRELSQKALSGGGFVEFYWQKPGENGEKLKMGYVEPIIGTSYFIGSGVYLE